MQMAEVKLGEKCCLLKVPSQPANKLFSLLLGLQMPARLLQESLVSFELTESLFALDLHCPLGFLACVKHGTLVPEELLTYRRQACVL